MYSNITILLHTPNPTTDLCAKQVDNTHFEICSKDHADSRTSPNVEACSLSKFSFRAFDSKFYFTRHTSISISIMPFAFQEAVLPATMLALGEQLCAVTQFSFFVILLWFLIFETSGGSLSFKYLALLEKVRQESIVFWIKLSFQWFRQLLRGGVA